jgi:hypothetical protein
MIKLSNYFDDYDELLEMIYGVDNDIPNDNGIIVNDIITFLSDEKVKHPHYELRNIALSVLNEFLKPYLNRYKRRKKLNQLINNG